MKRLDLKISMLRRKLWWEHGKHKYRGSKLVPRDSQQKCRGGKHKYRGSKHECRDSKHVICDIGLIEMSLNSHSIFIPEI